MKTNLLTHLVPTLPPNTGELGEYALSLARHLRDCCGINSQFILCDPDWNGPARIDGFPVHRLRFPNEARLWGLLASLKDDPTVLLHYDGNGYEKHGVPTWLYFGIKSWLADGNGRPTQSHKQFFTVFHELWGPAAKLWQRRFYLRMLQRRLVERLHHLSQVSITSGQQQQSELDAIEPRKTLLLPFPGSLPVIDRIMPRAGREEPMLVAIMAQEGPRSETIRAHANLLRTLDSTNRLAGAVLIGRLNQGAGALNEELALLHKFVSPDRIKILENRKPEDVSQFLNRADLFVSTAGGETACKSGPVIAALAAGCPVVLRNGQNASPLQEGQHFIASDDSPASVRRFEQMAQGGELERIATAGRIWYKRYADWPVIARKYQEALLAQVAVPPSPVPRMELPLLSLPAPTR
jgi:glycosyltransferase involved in cell wall biosynthesis